jgi:hypothetical protein
MPKVLTISVFTLSCALLSSCAKTYDLGPAETEDKVFEDLKLQPKTFTFDATVGGTFIGNSGTKYVFSPNSFTNAAGTLATGTIEMKATEYVQKGDMLFSKALPVSNNEPLISGGEIELSGTQGGQPIFLKSGATLAATIPQAKKTTDQMNLFMARPAADPAQNRVNWVVHDSVARPGQVNPGVTTNATGDSMTIISDSITMCNADRFLSNPNFQNFNVKIAVTGATLPSTTKVYAYAMFDNYKGEWPLGLIGSYNNGIFNEQHTPNIPVHFVAFAIIGGKFYGGIKAATPITNNTYTVTLTQVDKNTFKTQVNAL